MEEQTAFPVSNFTYHAVPHPEHYCILNTSDDAFLLDDRLSPSAIYVMTVIRSLQSGKWNFSAEGLAQYTHRGIDLIRSALRQLRQYGYCCTDLVRDGGKYVTKAFCFYDTSQSEALPSDVEPSTETPSTGKPSTGKPLMVKPSMAKPTQPNIKHTIYRNKPKTDIPKQPPSESRLTFDLDDIIEKPSAEWLEEHRSG